MGSEFQLGKMRQVLELDGVGSWSQCHHTAHLQSGYDGKCDVLCLYQVQKKTLLAKWKKIEQIKTPNSP